MVAIDVTTQPLPLDDSPHLAVGQVSRGLSRPVQAIKLGIVTCAAPQVQAPLASRGLSSNRDP